MSAVKPRRVVFKTARVHARVLWDVQTHKAGRTSDVAYSATVAVQRRLDTTAIQLGHRNMEVRG